MKSPTLGATNLAHLPVPHPMSKPSADFVNLFQEIKKIIFKQFFCLIITHTRLVVSDPLITKTFTVSLSKFFIKFYKLILPIIVNLFHQSNKFLGHKLLFFLHNFLIVERPKDLNLSCATAIISPS